jgi:hypothetical protein
MTARRGAPSSCVNAICTMLNSLPTLQVDAPYLGWRLAGATPVLPSRTNAMCLPTPQVDASSRGGMTARRGAPSSCVNATCTMLNSLPTLQVDAPYFGMPACGCNSSTPEPMMLHHSVSGCPVSWRDDGSSGCTVEPCNMLHAPCYAHSAGGCPSFRDDGSRGAPPSCANATRTKHHASPTLHVDAPLFSGMTARRLYRQAMQR